MEVLANNYELLVHSTDMFPVGTEVGVKVDPFDIQIMKNRNLKMRRLLHLKHRKLLAGPYLFWAVSFVIIPLLMIVYYGLTDKEGHFTFSNLGMMTSQENLKALGLRCFFP